MDKYEAFIAELNLTAQTAYGQCKHYAQKMLDAFPELTLTRGHYICPIWGEWEHWWLTFKDSCPLDPERISIIDPTRMQFPSDGYGEYIPWTEGAAEPTGMRPNCGEYCYDGDSLCSETCERSYMAYLKGGHL